MPVSLVIPGRNCAATLRPCLDAVVAIRDAPGSALEEIIFVDDGSTDETPRIAGALGIACLAGTGRGAGAARNLGWRAARHGLVWFVDADCVAEPDALERLLPHLDDPAVAGAGGSYGIMNPQSLLARLIHEEIVERHRAMPPDVDFLATFNVIYRRAVLEEIDGFDERYRKGQDAELAFRVLEAGGRLRFEIASRVRHFHEDRLATYLRVQRQQGYWRVFLHLEHRGHAGGDSYSDVLDHAQPVLALLVLGALPLGAAIAVAASAAEWPPWPARVAAIPPALPAALLLLAPLPMTLRLLRRARRTDVLAWWPMSVLRAFWRGAGLAQGALAWLGTRASSR